ncbi:hypothetical protein [Mesorhizobium sp. Cs1321R2N1]|uniref:hypothetical protein n=1 Tax=Mesorhizobium sp. Cs1321R2N1 TaxID=3015174 RepID=UPI00301D4EA0
MDRDTSRDRPGSSSRTGGGAARFTDMPSELLGKVAASVVSEDPVETANRLTNLRLASRSVRTDFERTSAGQFHERLNRLGDSAHRLYAAEMPPENVVPQDDLFFARYQTRAVRPILKFQTAPMKTAVVDRTLAIDEPRRQSLALSKLGQSIGDLSQLDRTRLLDRSLELFTQEGGGPAHFVIRNNTAKALKMGRDYLNENQREQLNTAFAQNPELASFYAAVEVQPAGHAAAPQNPDLDARINAIQDRAHQLPGDFASYQQQDAMAELGDSISETYNSARAELMRSNRSRDLTR